MKGEHVHEISDISRKLIKLRKSLICLKEIIPYLLKFTQTDEEVLYLLEAFEVSKFKTTMMLSMVLKYYLDNCFSKLDSNKDPKNKLIDELVLRLFIEYKFHVKKPYMGIPLWMNDYIAKLKEKYSAANS